MNYIYNYQVYITISVDSIAMCIVFRANFIYGITFSMYLYIIKIY